MVNEKSLKIAERVVSLRKAKDMSQADLARRVGLSKVALSQFERGIIRLTAENIGEIAKALHTSADYLIFGKENNKFQTIATNLIEKIIDLYSTLSKTDYNDNMKLIEFVTDRLGHDRKYSVDISKLKEMGWRDNCGSGFMSDLEETVVYYMGKFK